MRRALRWTLRGLVGVLVLAVVLAGAALIALHTAWGREQLRARAEASLRALFPGGATIGRITGSVLGELVIHDLALAQLDGTPFVTVGELRAEIALAPLARETVRVERLVADRLVLVAPAASPLAPGDPAAPPTTWSIELPAIEVRRATLRADLGPGAPPGARTLELADAALAAAVAVPAGGEVSARALLGGTLRGQRLAAGVVVRAGEVVRVPHAVLAIGGALVTARDVELAAPAGEVALVVPPAAVGALAPVGAAERDALVAALPGTVALAGALRAPGPAGEGLATLAGWAGAAAIDARALVDVARGDARGVLAVGPVDLAVAGAPIEGTARATIAAMLDGGRVRATVLGEARLAGGPPAHALLAVEAPLSVTPGAATVLALVTTAGGRAGGVLAGRRDGARAPDRDLAHQIVIDRADLGVEIAALRDIAALRALAPGLAPIGGALTATVSATGRLADVSARGRVAGWGLSAAGIAAGELRGRYEVRRADGAVTGVATVDVARVVRRGPGGGALGDGTATARLRRDGTVAVEARVRPAAAPLVAELAAVVDPRDPDAIAIALGAHRVALPAGTWAGAGGRVVITPARVRVEGVRSAMRDARLAVDATLGRTSRALAVQLEAEHVPARLADPTFAGTLDGAIALTRRGRAWSGEGALVARGLQLGPAAPALDGDARVTVEGRRVTVAGTASNPAVGGARVALAVRGPAELLDVAAWAHVPRDDLEEIAIGLDELQLARVTDGRAGGVIDGELRIRGGRPEGTLGVRAVPTPLGPARADLRIVRSDAGFLDLAASVAAGALAGDVTARLRTPPRPFEVEAWRALGANVLDGASVRTPALALGPALWSALGLDLPLRATATLAVDVDAGGAGVGLGLEARDIAGGPLVRPLAATVTARVDGAGTRVSAAVTTPTGVLLRLPEAASPATFALWTSAPRVALTRTLTGALAIPRTGARELLALLGRTDVTAGTVEGAVTLGGTLGAPAVTGVLDLRDVTVRPRLVGQKPPVLRALHVEAGWQGGVARVAVTGAESNGGMLDVRAEGRPDDPRTVRGKVAIAAFDLAPIAPFLSGPLVGARGKLDAQLAIARLGLDPGAVQGNVRLFGARLPLTPQLGTLRDAKLTADIGATGLRATLGGKIGGGAIELALQSDAALRTAEVTGAVTQLAMITELRPIIDAKLRGVLRREAAQVRGQLEILEAAVRIPPEAGAELLDTVVPEDVIFVDRPVVERRVLGLGRTPTHPWLVLDVALRSTKIEVPELAVVEAVLGTVEGELVISADEVVGVEGTVRVERATAEVFGHRYRVEQGEVKFAGDPLDPEFDLRLAHDFPSVTTFVKLSGHIDRVQRELTSDPPIYSENQLLGFFLGGAPGGDPTQQTADTGTALLGSVVSTSIARRLKKLLPVTLHVAGCTPGAGGEGSSCTFGRWLDEKTFVAYRRRLDARPDESASEGRLEYYVLPNLSLEVGADADRVGADILWRKRL